ncbi:MAG: hypothetical protein HY719_10275 [Planctomycetes bacterium]|nr:hypothetical protein [Planctomycetota bacterium]
MKSQSRRLFGRFPLAAALLASLASGCAGEDVHREGVETAGPAPAAETPAPAAPAEPVIAPAPAPQPAAVPVASPAGAPASPEAGVAPVAGGRAPLPPPPADDDILEKAKKEVAADLLSKKKLADDVVRIGIGRYQQGDYLEAARNFRLALDVDKDNRDAKRWLDDMRMITEQDTGSGALFRAERSVYLIQHQQQLAAISAHIKEGRRLFEEEKFDRAIEEFQKALERIRWLPSVYNVEGYKNEAEKYIEASKKARVLKKAQETAVNADIARRFEEANQKRELQKRNEEIRDLAKEAQKMFDRQLYDDATRVLNKILYRDPFNEDAKALLDITKRARDQKVEDTIRDEWRFHWQRAMTDLTLALVPQTAVFEWPSHEKWELVQARRVRVLQQEKKPVPRDVQEIENVLDTKRVNLDYTETPIADVLNQLRAEAGVNIVMTPEVRAMSDESHVNITNVRDIRLRTALELVLSVKELGYWIKNGALVVGTKEQVTKDSGELRVYDVRDLTGAITDFPGPVIKLNTSEAGSGVQPQPEGQPQGFTGDTLKELIQGNVRKDKWDAETAITYHNNGSLLIRNQPRVLDEVETLLADLRRAAGMLVTIEARFVTVADNFLEDIGVDLRDLGNRLGANALQVPGKGSNANIDDVLFGSAAQPQGAGTSANLGVFYNDNTDGDYKLRMEHLFDAAVGDPNIIDRTGGGSLQFTYIDDTQIQAILRAVQKSDRITLVTAPRITVFNTQRANVTLVNQVSYISDFQIEIAQGAFLADPVISSVQDGIVLDVRPTISADRKYITLELQPTTAELVRPIPTISTSLGANNQIVNIETPELTLRKVQTTVTVPDGGTILIGGLKKAREEDIEAGIPWLSNIPLLRFLVSRNAKAVLKENLVVLVRANISVLEELEEEQY